MAKSRSGVKWRWQLNVVARSEKHHRHLAKARINSGAAEKKLIKRSEARLAISHGGNAASAESIMAISILETALKISIRRQLSVLISLKAAMAQKKKNK